MSIKLMTKVWEHGPEDRTETLVLLALADRANDDGSSCYPSLDEITARCRLSRQGALNVIDRLDKKGYLTKESGGGRGNPNRYHLHPDALKGSSRFTENGAEKGKADKQKGKADKAKGSSSLDGNRHEPSKEPSESERAPAREDEQRDDPVAVLCSLWNVSPTTYQSDQIRQIVDDLSLWKTILRDLKMQNKDSKKAIGWAVEDYQDEVSDSLLTPEQQADPNWTVVNGERHYQGVPISELGPQQLNGAT